MILPEIMRCYFETIYYESQKKYTRLILKALGACFPPGEVLLITSEIESFSTRNFVTFFLILHVELKQNKIFSKFASWVT